jgi:hypothetical protein
VFSYLVNKANQSLKGNVIIFETINVSAGSTNFLFPPQSPNVYPYPTAGFIPTALTIRNNSTVAADVLAISSNLTDIPLPAGQGPLQLRAGEEIKLVFSGSPFNTTSPITGQPWAHDESGLGTAGFFYSNPGANTFDVDFIWEVII